MRKHNKPDVVKPTDKLKIEILRPEKIRFKAFNLQTFSIGSATRVKEKKNDFENCTWRSGQTSDDVDVNGFRQTVLSEIRVAHVLDVNRWLLKARDHTCEIFLFFQREVNLFSFLKRVFLDIEIISFWESVDQNYEGLRSHLWIKSFKSIDVILRWELNLRNSVE